MKELRDEPVWQQDFDFLLADSEWAHGPVKNRFTRSLRSRWRPAFINKLNEGKLYFPINSNTNPQFILCSSVQYLKKQQKIQRLEKATVEFEDAADMYAMSPQ